MRLPTRPAGIPIAVFAGGSLYLLAATAIAEPSSAYAFVGPRAFPLVIGAGLLLCALWLNVERAAESTPKANRPEWFRVCAVAAVLAGYVAALETVGYLLSTTALTIAVTFILGTRHKLRDSVASAAMAVAAYIVFEWLLRKGLPHGWLG